MKEPNDLTFFQPVSLDRLLGMIMELAEQLNVECYRRMALEEVLRRRGILDLGEIDALASDRSLAEEARAELEANLSRLFQPILGYGHPLHPLRPRENLHNDPTNSEENQ